MITVKKAAVIATTGLFIASVAVALVIGIFQTYDGQNLKSLTQDNLTLQHENRALISSVHHLEGRLSESELKIQLLEFIFVPY